MQNDLDALQGTWLITKLESDGSDAPAIVFEHARITIKGDTFKSIGMGAEYSGQLQLDSSVKPKKFDLIFTAGHAKGTTHKGIYKLSQDGWTLCLSTTMSKRPKSFTTKVGSGLIVETFARAGRRNVKNRELKRKAVTVEETIIGKATEIEGEWAMVSAVFNGAAMDPSYVKFCRRITTGDITKVVAGPETFVHARFVLDRSSKIGRISYSNLSGGNKGKDQDGIFELKNGTLKVCMSAPGKPRPGTFSSESGDGRSLTTWKKLK